MYSIKKIMNDSNIYRYRFKVINRYKYDEKKTEIDIYYYFKTFNYCV